MTKSYAMSRQLLLLLPLMLGLGSFMHTTSAETSDEPTSEPAPEIQFVSFVTEYGDIKIKLHRDKAPKTVENFLNYANRGFYNGTIFHRVIPNFVIQGGGFSFDFVKRPTEEPVINESIKGLSNRKGTVAMARTSNPDSATSQFYINLSNNLNLDADGDREGYTVFGTVIEGMNVVKTLSKQPTQQFGPYANVPKQPIIIMNTQLHPQP